MSLAASRIVALLLMSPVAMASLWAPEMMNGAYAVQATEPEACDAGSCCATGEAQQANTDPEREEPAPCCPGVVCMPVVFALPCGIMQLIAPERTLSILRHGDGDDAMASFIAPVWRPPNAGGPLFKEVSTHQKQPTK